MISTKKLTSEYLDNLDNIKSVLDLGCGVGRKSLRFAKKGIKVIGIDKKNPEIQQENFKFIQEDINNLNFNENYDLIITSMILHFFNKDKAVEIINKIQKSTEKNGYNFLICMSNKDDCSKKGPNNFYPTLEELKKLYDSKYWEIVKSDQDFTDWEEHDSTKKHRHNLILMLIKKII
jgi:tellurite methyltransferase